MRSGVRPRVFYPSQDSLFSFKEWPECLCRFLAGASPGQHPSHHSLRGGGGSVGPGRSGRPFGRNAHPGDSKALRLAVGSGDRWIGGALLRLFRMERDLCYISGLSEDLERLLELLLEIYTQPAFSPEEFEQLKQRRIGQLVQQKDESQIIADERFQEILFQGTSYDHPVYGTLDSLPKLAVEETREFHRENFLLPGSFMVLVGDFQPERCFQWVRAKFPSVSHEEDPGRRILPLSSIRGSEPRSLTAPI